VMGRAVKVQLSNMTHSAPATSTHAAYPCAATLCDPALTMTCECDSSLASKLISLWVARLAQREPLSAAGC